MITLKTLYIDVYFLINFSVDVLAIFIALKISTIKNRPTRIIISGVIGAAFAILNILSLNKNIVRFISAISYVLFMSFYLCKGASLKRRVNFIAFYYLCIFIISGVVTYAYDALDKYLYGFFNNNSDVVENRAALKGSLVILLLIGVLRALIMVFTNSINEKSVRIYIKIGEKTLETDALLDSGNLVKDPMNMNPVLFLKKIAANSIFPPEVFELCDIDKLDNAYKKRVRLVPVTKNGETHVMMGVRADTVAVYSRSGNREEIEATIVIDREGGTYGGFEALIPYAAVRDVI